jgi:peptide chain release factor 1
MFDKLTTVESQYDELMSRLGSAEVQADQAEYRKAAKTLSDLEPLVEKYREYKNVQRDLEGADELARGSDVEMRDLAQDELEGLRQKKDAILEELRRLLIPKDPNDEKNVLLEIRAGTGGDEAALFAAELYRMYHRYAERQGWRLEVMSSSDSGGGGLKEIIASISGRGVYSRLKYESGVHRVQRVPATEASGRIHTSTATVAVLPEAEDVDIQINEKDIRKDTFCSSGPGGQSVNTTYSAIRLTHLPTGIVVSQQDEKSQIKNLAKAMKVLRARLYEMELRKQQEEIASERRGQVGTGERSEKIRTYNFPQSRITDHRINFTTHRLDDVLEGDVAELIDQVTSFYNAEKLRQATSSDGAGDDTRH